MLNKNDVEVIYELHMKPMPDADSINKALLLHFTIRFTLLIEYLVVYTENMIIHNPYTLSPLKQTFLIFH